MNKNKRNKNSKKNNKDNKIRIRIIPMRTMIK